MEDSFAKTATAFSGCCRKQKLHRHQGRKGHQYASVFRVLVSNQNHFDVPGRSVRGRITVLLTCRSSSVVFL